MHIETLHLEHFRNINRLEIACHPKLNLITGKNGAGKTSLLEAIYFLSHGRSFRAKELNRLVMEGSQSFTLFANACGKGAKQQIGMMRHLSREAKNRLNGNDLKSTLLITELLPVLLFNPEGFSLLTGPGKLRRQLIDWGVFYHFPHCHVHYKALRQALKQRNAALKMGALSKNIKAWDTLLVTHASAIDSYRRPYLETLIALLHELIPGFLSQHCLALQYYQGWAADEPLEAALTRSYLQDKARGRTHYGAHHADLKILSGRRLARDILSRGQQKFLICALKIAQGILLHRHTGRTPIYLFDDLASELDRENRQLIATHIEKQSAQVFITGIDGSALFFGEPHAKFHLEEGTLKTA